MTARPNLAQTLTDWEQTLQETLAASEAADWGAYRRLLRCSQRHYDRLRALLQAHLAAGDEALVESYRERVLADVARLQQLVASLQTWQADIQSKIQGRRRARRTAQSYRPSTPTGPRHFRLYARSSGQAKGPGTD
jgi:signal-transduction protein with cAMP-binding, CBS, and nucleotidyltransferase domain